MSCKGNENLSNIEANYQLGTSDFTPINKSINL